MAGSASCSRWESRARQKANAFSIFDDFWEYREGLLAIVHAARRSGKRARHA